MFSNFQVEISTEGQPTVVKSLRETEAVLNKHCSNPFNVSIAITTLQMSGRASIVIRGVTFNLKRVW